MSEKVDSDNVDEFLEEIPGVEPRRCYRVDQGNHSNCQRDE